MICKLHNTPYAWNEDCPDCKAGVPAAEPEPSLPVEAPLRPSWAGCKATGMHLKEEGVDFIVVLESQPEAAMAAILASIPYATVSEYGLTREITGEKVALVMSDKSVSELAKARQFLSVGSELMTEEEKSRTLLTCAIGDSGTGTFDIGPRTLPVVYQDHGRCNVGIHVARPKRSANSLTIASTHFNWSDSEHSRRKYFKWVPSLGDLRGSLLMMEASMSGVQEIPGSNLIHATRNNLIWQKEPLLNLALSQCETEFFAWIDDDVVIQDPRWFDIAAEKLDHCSAVQLFSQVRYLNKDDRMILHNKAAVWNLNENGDRNGSPGGAWMCRTDELRTLGGFPTHCPVGAGDQSVFCLMSGQSEAEYTLRFGKGYQQADNEYLERAKYSRGVDYVDCDAIHIWHGDREHRQYIKRHTILASNNYSKRMTIIAENGLMEWAEGTSETLKDDVARYFEDRREDG